MKNWLIKSFNSFIHSEGWMNPGLSPWPGVLGQAPTGVSELVPCRNAHVGSGRVLCWGDILDQVFWDMRMVGLGSSQTQVSFGYASITLHVPQFHTLFPYPSVSGRSFWEGEQQKVVSQLLCATSKTFRERELGLGTCWVFSVSGHVSLVSPSPPLPLPYLTISSWFPARELWVLMRSQMLCLIFPDDCIFIFRCLPSSNLSFTVSPSFSFVCVTFL